MMKLRLLALYALSVVGNSALVQASYIVENDTRSFIFVAPVRTKSGSNYRTFYTDANYQRGDIKIYAIAPGQQVVINADSESGFSVSGNKYDRVLWVSYELSRIGNALRNGNASLLSTLYLGRNQSGIKYITYDNDVEKYKLVRSQGEALKQIGIDSTQLQYIGSEYKGGTDAFGGSLFITYSDLNGAGIHKISQQFKKYNDTIKQRLEHKYS